jgi:nitroreductase
MTPYTTIISHRAVREFQDRPIPDDALHRILQAGRMSGSSKNSQPWWFVVVRDADTRQRLSRCGDFAGHLVSAPLAIAIVFDPKFYRGEFDSGRAVQNMMLAAWADGIGSCIASMHREAEAKAVLGVPDEHRLQHVLSFGYPLSQPGAATDARTSKRSGRKPMETLVHYEKWR